MIPKRIFYCWITIDESNPGLPSQYQVAIDQWKSIARPEDGWEYILVDWNYMKSNYDSNVIREMNNIRVRSKVPQAKISDYCRLVVTIDKGGFYMDLDTIISPSFLDLVNIDAPIISARPKIDYQFMCHPGGGSIIKDREEGLKIYYPYRRLIVGNYKLGLKGVDIDSARDIFTKRLNNLHDGFKMHNLCSWPSVRGYTSYYTRYFYPNQPLFHFDFSSHDGSRSGFETEFNSFKVAFLDYYSQHKG